jgi:PRTRC genetic system protein C
MKVTQAVREFGYNGIRLPDPSVVLTPEEVKAVYSAHYPELATASIEGPEVVGDKLRYQFRISVGTKG